MAFQKELTCSSSASLELACVGRIMRDMHDSSLNEYYVNYIVP